MGKSVQKSLNKKIIPIYPYNVDVSKFENAKVYNGVIEDEVKAPETPKCFLGAYYRKVFSSFDKWLGVEGVITLGEFKNDPERYQLDPRVNVYRYLDNPSVYVGGKSLFESDAGLNMNISYPDGNLKKELNLGSPKVAYIPFWRYIYDEVEDVGTKINRNYVNSWNNVDCHDVEYYFFPGDKIRMSLFVPIENYLQLKIELLEPTTISKYADMRKKYPRKPKTFYSPIFFSEGHGSRNAEFKRVNSIDQYNNEGFVVSKTNATVSEAVWEEFYLYRKIKGKIYKVPFNEQRQTSMICPNLESFTVKKHNETGEKIIITPKFERK